MSGSHNGDYVNKGAESSDPDSKASAAPAPVSPYLIRLLKDVYDWIDRNPPTDGWGLLDKGEDDERRAILKRLSALLEDLP